jgi:hypothetical protein
MKKISAAFICMLVMTSVASAASVINRDADTQILMVTEGADKAELTVGAGETVEFCTGGCFVTMPNGDREALTGSETVEISGGAAKIK